MTANDMQTLPPAPDLGPLVQLLRVAESTVAREARLEAYDAFLVLAALLGIDAVAKRMGVQPSTAYAWKKEGKLPQKYHTAVRRVALELAGAVLVLVVGP